MTPPSPGTSGAVPRTLPVVLALGAAQMLAWGSTYYLPAILAGSIAADLGVSSGLVFAAFSAALVVAAILGPAIGHRIDRFGGRGVLSLSSLILAAGLTFLAAADGPAMLFAAWLVIGVGMAAGLYESAFATLAHIYGHRARGAITGITLLAGLASTVAWPVTAFLDAEFGWRAACLAWAAAHLLIGLPLNRLAIPRGASTSTDAGHAPAIGLTGSPPRPRLAMALLALIFAVTWFISTAMAAHLPGLLQATGASPVAAIAAAALVGPAQVAGRLVEFGLLRRMHPLLSARLAALCHPIGGAAAIAFGAPVAAVFTILHGAGNGILTIAKGTLPLAIFGPAGYGHRQGVLMVPARFAQALAPFVFALLLERYAAWSLLLTIGLGLLALAALLMLAAPSANGSPTGTGAAG